MLSESSYLTALYTYIGAACAILLCLGWWLSRSWRAGWVTLIVLLAAALLLTPAYPREDAGTLAPALIVAAFALLTEGPEAAEHALKPLALMSGLALVLTLLLSLTVFRRRRAAPADKPAQVEQA
ncbi:MAG: hypothetical protein P8Y92_07080 [Halioglobus sp.]